MWRVSADSTGLESTLQLHESWRACRRPEKIWWLPSGDLDTTRIFWEGSFVLCSRGASPGHLRGIFFVLLVGSPEEVQEGDKKCSVLR